MCAPGSKPAGAAGGAREATRGYTLVELLAVIAIVVGLAAVSIGVVAALPSRYAHEQAAQQLKAMLRRARAAALESRAPAEVVVASGELQVRSWQQLLHLRFDDLPPAPQVVDPSSGEVLVTPVDGVTRGPRGALARVARVVPDPGQTGMAVFCEEPGALVDCGNAPLLSPRHGLRVEVWANPAPPAALGLDDRPPPPGEDDGAARMFQLAGKAGEWALWMAEDYGLVAIVEGQDQRGRRVRAVRETRPGLLRPGGWREVALEVERREVRILVDGLRYDLPADDDADPVPTVLGSGAAPLYLSSPEPGLGFLGGLDELRLTGLAAEATYPLPGGVAIAGIPVVRFDRNGELDPLHHDGPVRFVVGLADPAAATGAGAKAERVVVLERSGTLR